ncbi:NKAP domain containing 1 [Seriola aureovittata]|uniref:NKAP domain containing 1 n=1 Tax=Seriola aureovittata TaxID=2871759 RepID=UPI0024BEF6BE|nr:NKAP domain containing 1 [Seriola aureovittata]
MSKQPLGKTLLRNVIRHTDAHNKIQEEMEMWKMRGWETSHNKHFSDTECARGRMHCDRVPYEARDLSRGRERVSEHDDREARYWSRKLYEFEAKDPDRWGHSGFKELYPEEFESDRATKKLLRHKMKRSKSDTEASLSKHSKKSSRKKKKKKKKKNGEVKRKKTKCSSSDDSSDDSSVTKDKQRRKRTKSRRKDKKSAKARRRDDDSSSGDSDDGGRERQTHSRKKSKQDSHKDSDSGPNSEKKRRKNWRAAGEESSDHSSAD